MNRENSNSNGHRPASDELAWQCDRLLLDDLSIAEGDRLIEQFANDQTARETLATEVLLLETLAQLETADFNAPVQQAANTTETSTAPAPTWTRSVIWAATVAMAGCLLIAATVGQQWDWSGTDTDPIEVAATPASLDELASHWSENHELYESLALVDVSTDFLPREREHDSEELAPDWMFAAVEAEAGEGMGEENEQWQ